MDTQHAQKALFKIIPSSPCILSSFFFHLLFNHGMGAFALRKFVCYFIGCALFWGLLKRMIDSCTNALRNTICRQRFNGSFAECWVFSDRLLLFKIIRIAVIYSFGLLDSCSSFGSGHFTFYSKVCFLVKVGSCRVIWQNLVNNRIWPQATKIINFEYWKKDKRKRRWVCHPTGGTYCRICPDNPSAIYYQYS